MRFLEQVVEFETPVAGHHGHEVVAARFSRADWVPGKPEKFSFWCRTCKGGWSASTCAAKHRVVWERTYDYTPTKGKREDD